MESRRTGDPQPGRDDRRPWSTSREVLVSQSAIGYYGDRGEAIVDESTAPADSFDAEVVVDWEEAAHEVDAPACASRSSAPATSSTRAAACSAQLLPPFKLGVGGPLAGGNQYMSWIHIDDEVGVLLWALDNDKASGVLNATAPNPVTNKVFSKALGKALGRPAVLPVPGFALDLAVRERVRPGPAGRPAGDAAPDSGSRVRVSASRPRQGARRPASRHGKGRSPLPKRAAEPLLSVLGGVT